MEIEYIFPDPEDERKFNKEIKRLQRENAIGCLVMGLFFLAGLFIFLSILPVILLILGYAVIALSLYIIYKAYVEETVLALIEKIKSRQ